MIVAVGIDVDDTFCHFVRAALVAKAQVSVVNLRAAVDGEWRFDVPHGPATLRYAGRTFTLDPDDSYYCRVIDLSSHGEDTPRARAWHSLLSGLRAWLDGVRGPIANRAQAGSHNSAKPLHEALLAELGFQVPESLTSSDAVELMRFTREGPTISKTVCGVRADAIAVTEADFREFVPESGPVHLQRLVRGADARIHVAGESVVAQRVTTTHEDYRRAGVLDDLVLFDPPVDLRKRLVDATGHIGLAFAGWDFKIDEAGHYWCLEVNPVPGYGVYDRRCGGAISQALIGMLAKGARS